MTGDSRDDADSAREHVDDDVLAADTAEEAVAAEAVEDDLARLATERDEYLDTLRRLQADFENYKKRVAREHEDRVSRATEGLMTQLLDVLDSFELAIAHIEDSNDVEKLRKGVEQVYAQLLGTLEKAGLARIDSDAAVFDPELHEAVLHEELAEPVDIPTVVQTMRTG